MEGKGGEKMEDSGGERTDCIGCIEDEEGGGSCWGET